MYYVTPDCCILSDEMISLTGIVYWEASLCFTLLVYVMVYGLIFQGIHIFYKVQ